MKISYKIGIFSILIALLPMIVVSGIGYVKSHKMLLDGQMKSSEQSVNAVYSQLIAKIEETKKISHFLTESIEIHGVDAGFKAFHSVASNYPDFKNLYFGDEATGRFLITPSVDLPEDYDPRRRPWYTITNDKSPVVSAPYLDAASGATTVTLSKAVFKDGKKIGVVGIDFNFGEIAKQINEIKIGETGYLFVLYKDGTTLTHPNTKIIGKNLTKKLSFLTSMLELKNGLLDYDYSAKKRENK